MTYKEEVIMAFEESLKSYGYPEQIIEFFCKSFATGFDAAYFKDSDRDLQVQMIKAILQDEIVN